MQIIGDGATLAWLSLAYDEHEFNDLDRMTTKTNRRRLFGILTPSVPNAQSFPSTIPLTHYSILLLSILYLHVCSLLVQGLSLLLLHSLGHTTLVAT
jgi:hypothetical protein